MQIPQWLAGMTGANKFAMNPANGFNPTLGDALQGIGSSMMDHYRRGEGMGIPTPSGTPMSAPQNMPAPLAQTPAPAPRPMGAPQQLFDFGDPAQILQQLQGIQTPQLSPIGSVLGRL